MISIAVIGLLILVVLFQIAQLKATINHTTIMTVVHADFNHLITEIKNLKGEKSDS